MNILPNYRWFIRVAELGENRKLVEKQVHKKHPAIQVLFW